MAILTLALLVLDPWGIAIKASLVCLCIGIVLLISWRKKNNVFCKQCKKRVHASDAHCKNCGAQITDSNTEVVIGVSGKSRVIGVLSVAILVGVLGLSVASYAASHDFTGYATGMYSDLRQTYKQNDQIWGVECKSALTEGAFNRTIAVNGDSPESLRIESSCDSGTLILNIKQGDRVDSIDISNTSGVARYSLADYEDNSDIKLSVEHTTGKNIQFKISWE